MSAQHGCTGKAGVAAPGWEPATRLCPTPERQECQRTRPRDPLSHHQLIPAPSQPQVFAGAQGSCAGVVWGVGCV